MNFSFGLPIGCQKVLMHLNYHGEKYWLVKGPSKNRWFRHRLQICISSGGGWNFGPGISTQLKVEYPPPPPDFNNALNKDRTKHGFWVRNRPDTTKVYSAEKNQRFDDFIMLVWVQGSPFHIAARSHPVQEEWGSQDSLYRGQIQKLLQCCQKPYQQIPLVITIQKKYSLTYLWCTVS